MTRLLLAATAGGLAVYAAAVRPLRRELDAARVQANHAYLDYQLRHRTGRVPPPRGTRAS